MPLRCQAPDEAPRLRLAASFRTDGRRFHDQRPDPAARVGLGLDPGPQPALGPGQRLANRILLKDREPCHRSLAGHERVTHPGDLTAHPELGRQLGPAAENPVGNRVARHLQHLGNLRLRPAEHGAHDHRGPHRGRQRGERAEYLARVGGLLRGRVRRNGHRQLLGGPAPALAAPESSHRHLQHPRFRCVVSADLGPAPQRDDVGLLHRVLGVTPVPRGHDRGRQDLSEGPLIELREAVVTQLGPSRSPRPGWCTEHRHRPPPMPRKARCRSRSSS